MGARSFRFLCCNGNSGAEVPIIMNAAVVNAVGYSRPAWGKYHPKTASD